MNLSKKPCLIYDATQGGATFESFDEERCRREIIVPTRKLFELGGLVDMVLFVIVCDPKTNAFETGKEVLVGSSISPSPRYITPTSAFLAEEMRNERADRLFEYLHIMIHADRDEFVRDYAISFAKLHGPDGVIVSGSGPFPKVREVLNATAHLEYGGVCDLTVTTIPE